VALQPLADRRHRCGRETSGTAKNAWYYLLAFAVGYREQTFRALVKRLVDVILTPGASGSPTVTGAFPSSGTIAGGEPVTITGSNLRQTTAVWFGDRMATLVGKPSDTKVAVKTPPVDAPGRVPVAVVTDDGSDSYESFVYRSTSPASGS
jgi:hypothetical protein